MSMTTLSVRRVFFHVLAQVIGIITIVVVIIITFLTNIEVVKSNSKDFSSYSRKVLTDAAHQCVLALPTLNNKDDTVYQGRKDDRIGDSDKRRRVQDDVIESLLQRAEQIFHVFRTYQFGRVGWHKTTRKNRKVRHRGPLDKLFKRAATGQKSG